MTTLDRLEAGCASTICQIDCDDPVLRGKLLSLGMVPGQTVEVCHFAPLGDPMTIRCTGASVALRLSEARCISVKAT